MKPSSSIHTVIAVISFFIILLFLNLNNFEIQPWDEGLYAIRAKAVLEHKLYFDQTEYSAGGLYSSTYPPLTVWLLALSMNYLGESPLAIRFFSVIFSILSLVLIYNISRKIFSIENSLISIFLLSTTLGWNFYSRQGMTDVPLTFFFLLCFWASIKIFEAREAKHLALWAAVFSLSFASALMTKIIISFLPLIFVFT